MPAWIQPVWQKRSVKIMIQAVLPLLLALQLSFMTVVGKVVETRTGEGAPLLYYRRGYRTVTDL